MITISNLLRVNNTLIILHIRENDYSLPFIFHIRANAMGMEEIVKVLLWENAWRGDELVGVCGWICSSKWSDGHGIG